MRSLGWPLIIILTLAFVWLLFLMPVAVNNSKDGFAEYIDSIPITGTPEQVHESYDGIWGFLPPKCRIENLKMQGARYETDNLILFDPDLTIEYVNFKPLPMMKTATLEIEKIGHVDFKAKIPYQVMARLLKERNPNFKVSSMGMAGPKLIQVTGRLNEVQSEVVITGSLEVNIDGEIELKPLEVTNFLNEAVVDARARGKVLDAVDLKWRFQILNMELNVNRAAISNQGVYIESESEGWVPKEVVEKPVEEEKSQSSS
jgi:hypothetical protein